MVPLLRPVKTTQSTNVLRHPQDTDSFDKPKQRMPKPPYRSWATFDPYADNVGCTIRVSRRPSSLVAPPKARAIKKAPPEEKKPAATKAPAKPPPKEEAAPATVPAEEEPVAAEPVEPPPPEPPADEPDEPSDKSPFKQPSPRKEAAPNTVTVHASRSALPPPPPAAPPPPSNPAPPYEAPRAQKASVSGGPSPRSVPSADTFLGLPPMHAPRHWLGSNGSYVPLLPPSPQKKGQLTTTAAGCGGGGAAIDDASGLSPEGALVSTTPGAVPLLNIPPNSGERWSASKPITNPGFSSAAASAAANAAAAAAAAIAAVSEGVNVPLVPAGSPPSAGERARAAAEAPSLMQLEELDSLLQEHQKQLRQRVDALREEKRRQHEEWYADIERILPTPTKKAPSEVSAPTSAGEKAPTGVLPPPPPEPVPPVSPSFKTVMPGMPPLRDASSPTRPLGVSEWPLPPSNLAAALADGQAANGASNRSSLESLSELEALLEEQHKQLIEKGFIAPTADAPWKSVLGDVKAQQAVSIQ